MTGPVLIGSGEIAVWECPDILAAALHKHNCSKTLAKKHELKYDLRACLLMLRGQLESCNNGFIQIIRTLSCLITLFPEDAFLKIIH